ncbi:MAG: hypothetical protein ACTSSH_03270 [Candidatus Heimdallarchaeota archaeon]
MLKRKVFTSLFILIVLTVSFSLEDIQSQIQVKPYRITFEKQALKAL